MGKLGILAVPAVVFLVGGALADTPKEQMGTHIVLVPNDLKWGEGPPGLPKGAKVAVLEGDPAKAGPYTIRAEFPAGYQIKPHWHPELEHITVLSGEFYVGHGEKFDMATAKMLPQGGFAVMPIKHNHYAFTKDRPATIQLHGIGPFGITYVNPKDDPRGAQPKK